MAEPARELGCERCTGESRPQSWSEVRERLSPDTNLVQESHLLVAVWRCSACRQAFLYLWTELIDWRGGNDPVYVTLVPLDESELATVEAAGDELDVAFIAGLGDDRRWLAYDRPSGAPARFGWRTGRIALDWGH